MGRTIQRGGPGTWAHPAPLILLGHPGGLHRLYPRLLARARHSVSAGFAAATIELPGGGDRPRFAAVEEARADLHRALAAGEPVDDGIVDRLVLPLVDEAVPEWRAALDDLLALSRRPGRSPSRCRSCCSETTRGTTGRVLELFDAFDSKEKTLHANMCGHTGVPQFEGTTGTASSPGT